MASIRRRVGTLLALCLVSAEMAASAMDGVDALKTPPTARDISMGGVLAMSAGAESLFYNPAGIGNLLRPALSLTHTQLNEGARLDALSLAYPLNEGWGRLGVSLMALTMPAIPGRDAQGQSAASFTAMDAILGLSWAGEIRHGDEGRARVGTTVKRIEQRLADVGAVGYALDLGAQTNLPAAPRVSLALSVQNLGPKMRFIDESFSLPLTVSVGGGYMLGDALLLQCGASHRPNAGLTTLGLGAEWWMNRSLALRTGYLSAATSSSANVRSQNPLVGIGAGAGWRPMKGDLRIDYAYSLAGADRGGMHRITLGWDFGQGRAKPAKLSARTNDDLMNLDDFWRVRSPSQGD